MMDWARELFTQAGITQVGNETVLRYALASRILWCAIPLVAAAVGTGGWMLVRWHLRRVEQPSPSVTPVKVCSSAALLFAFVMSGVVVPGVFLAEVRIGPSEAVQNVGLWWQNDEIRLAYDEIAAIVIRTVEGEFGPEPVWWIIGASGQTWQFNPGDLWSTHQMTIRDQMQKHGVRFHHPES